MECAFRSGARSLDFLAGDFEYKRRWTAETRTVLDLEGYAPWSWRARVFLLLRWLRRQTMKPKVQAGKVEAAESGESDAVG